MENKTAVEWLLEQFEQVHTQRKWKEIIEKAKKMEKQQISKSFEDGKLNPFINTGELYYNENFNN